MGGTIGETDGAKGDSYDNSMLRSRSQKEAVFSPIDTVAAADADGRMQKRGKDEKVFEAGSN